MEKSHRGAKEAAPVLDNWDVLRETALGCTACKLCRGRQHVVFGVGCPTAQIMLIGEGPGQHEDEQGEPFVGRSGQLMDKMLRYIDLDRSRNVYIANIVKCRPPQNRDPEPEEIAACMGYLRNQVALVRPKVIVLLGSTAAKHTIGPEVRITRDRGRWFNSKGTWMLPTYHPSALLRDPAKKREAWEDMQSLRDELMELGLYADLYGSVNEQPHREG